jgi:hypothetical protein
MDTNIVKWWKNKWAVLLIMVGILSIGIGFVFAHFISWGWILSLLVVAIGGIGMRHIAFKMIGEHNNDGKI